MLIIYILYEFKTPIKYSLIEEKKKRNDICKEEIMIKDKK